MFDAIRKLLCGRKSAKRDRSHTIEECPDCGVANGNLHDLFCTKERCPFCGNQLITCNCIHEVLRLSDEEQRTLDEFIDDSVPPLSEIMQRWKNALNTKGRIPFEAIPDDPIRAAHRGDVDAVRSFLNDNFPPNAGNEVGCTALMGAARGASLKVIQLLLSCGAHVTLADKRGYTALHCAVAQPTADAVKQVACVLALIKGGADPNARNEEGITPLMNAAWFGCHESVQELLRHGAIPTLTDNKGRTAKNLATTRGHILVAELLG